MNQKKFEEALSSYSQLGESPATVTLDTPAGKWIISVQEGSDSWDNFYPVRGKTREDLRQWLIAEGLLSHDRDEFSPEDLPAGCQEIAEKVCRREEAELREREIGAELDMILTTTRFTATIWTVYFDAGHYNIPQPLPPALFAELLERGFPHRSQNRRDASLGNRLRLHPHSGKQLRHHRL